MYNQKLICFIWVLTLSLTSCVSNKPVAGRLWKQAAAVLRDQTLKEAQWAMTRQPETVTTTRSSRSTGGLHDFYSEGDYWWPNPNHPDSPYVQRDGLTNPDNFVAHRQAMIRFSRIAGALASAYELTHDKKYIRQLLIHCRAWFTDSATYMHPNLLYAQAVKGRYTGRGIGIIDTIQLMEVAQALWLLETQGVFKAGELDDIRSWFKQYLHWLTTHPYGKDELKAENNHGTCWVMQAVVFARFTGDTALVNFCRNRFTTVLLPMQMEQNGSFPRELKRTKAYGYSIFNLDAMATIAQVLSDRTHDLWNYVSADGKSLKKGIYYLYPYINNKSAWPLKPDVQYWDNWPVAQPFLIFGANAYDDDDLFDTWKKLDHNPATEEVIRNLPVRHILIWLN